MHRNSINNQLNIKINDKNAKQLNNIKQLQQNNIFTCKSKSKRNKRKNKRNLSELKHAKQNVRCSKKINELKKGKNNNKYKRN